MRWLDSITDLMDVSLSELWEMVMARDAKCPAVNRIVLPHSRCQQFSH